MLSDAKIRAAKPRDKAYKLTDAKRLFLFVSTSGSKLWRWNYSYDGKQKTLALGAYPQVSLADARAKRTKASGQLSEGYDPLVLKRLMIAENLDAGRWAFERVARAWHENAKSRWAIVHAADVIRSLERDVFPKIGRLPITQLTPPLILAVLREIEARGSIETAKRIRQRISAVFVYGLAEGIVQSDPAEKLGPALKPLRKGRQPAITDLVALRQMILAAEEDYSRPITRLALRLMALSAVRPSELRGAQWDEFDDLNGLEPLWRIPAARNKRDLNRREEPDGDRLVPITPQALAVLRALWPLSGSGRLLFPNNRHPHRPMSENAIGYLLNRAGYHGRHVPHGFRTAFSTIMNEWAEREGKEHDREIIDLILGRVSAGEVDGTYNRAAYMQRRRELALIWAEKISEGLPDPLSLIERPSKALGEHRRRRLPSPVAADFRFPIRRRAARPR